MLTPVRITPDEKELLVDWYRQGTSALIRSRTHAVLMNSQGLSAKKISQLMFRDYGTVRSWLAGLFSKYRGNHRASKLTPEQRAQIQQVLSRPPSEYGIPKQFWQVKDLKSWIKTEFGVIYESDRSYHFLFKLGRFSWKLPDKFDIKRDDQVVKAGLAEIKAKITPFLADDNWVVLAGDETRLMWESESRRAWLRTNRKTLLKVHRSQDYRSFLGC